MQSEEGPLICLGALWLTYLQGDPWSIMMLRTVRRHGPIYSRNPKYTISAKWIMLKFSNEAKKDDGL